MKKREYDVLRSRFLRIYANIPQNIRAKDIIVMVGDEPYTWNTAAFEILNNKERAKKILKILKEELKIL